MKKVLLFAVVAAFLISCNDSPYDQQGLTSGSGNEADQSTPTKVIPVEEPKIIDVDTAFVRANKK